METANGKNKDVIAMDEYRRLPELAADGRLRAGKAGKCGMLRQQANDDRAPLLLENDNPAAAGWSSHCLIDRCFYMPGTETDGGYHIYFSARADMQGVCSELAIRLWVYEEKEGTFRELRSVQETDTGSLRCDVMWEFAGNEEEIADYIPYAQFLWTNQAGTHSACQVSRFRYRLDELLSKYEHAWPKKECIAQIFDPAKPAPVPVYGSGQTPPPFSESNPDSYVLVALFRRPEDLHDCDYVCYVQKEAGQPHIEVPFLCRLTAAKNWRFRELWAAQSFCTLTDKSGTSGGVRLIAGLHENYIESGFVFKASEDRRTATVSLISPWKEHTLQPGDMKKFFYDMDLHLELVMEEKDNPKHTETAFLDLSNRNGNIPSDFCEEEMRLYPIALMWGCLAEDTQICMADGSKKRISEISIGEMIMQPEDGRPVKVQNIWKGMEEALILIRTEEGDVVRMTKEHPVYQGNGFIRAGELKPGDTVYGEAGRKLTVAAAGTAPYGGFVYSLELEHGGGGGRMLANGIVVGDFGVQNGR